MSELTVDIVCGGRPGEKASFEGECVLVGRSEQADIRLEHHSVSRNHCRLIREGDSLFVEDAGSTNGTWLLGRRIDRRIHLPLNTPLRLGGVVLRVVRSEDEPAAPPDSLLCEFRPLDEASDEGGRDGADDWQFRALESLLTFQWGTLPEGKDRFDQAMLESFLSMTGASAALLLEYDSTTGRIMARRDLLTPLLVGDATPFDPRLAERSMMKGVAMAVRSINGSTVLLPLIGRHQVNGVVLLEGVPPSASSSENLRFWCLTAMVAGASIEHMRMVETSNRNEALLITGLNAAEFSHCVKNIISSMDAAMKLLTAALRDRQLERAEEARMLLAVNQRRIGNLVLDILSFSGGRRPKHEMTNARELTAEVIETLRAQFTFNRVELRLSETVAEPPPMAELDPSGLRRVLMNLLANAEEAVMSQCLRDHSRKGLVKVSVSRRGDDEIAIAVEDNGYGVEPEARNRLFTPFFSTKGTHGTGLGLHVSRKIVEAHGGSISFEPVDGKEGGARFVVILPVCRKYTETDTHKLGRDGQTLLSIPADSAG